MPIIFIVSTFSILCPFPLFVLYVSHLSIHLLSCLLPIPPFPFLLVCLDFFHGSIHLLLHLALFHELLPWSLLSYCLHLWFQFLFLHHCLHCGLFHHHLYHRFLLHVQSCCQCYFFHSPCHLSIIVIAFIFTFLIAVCGIIAFTFTAAIYAIFC
jgi:hypothetical protein